MTGDWARQDIFTGIFDEVIISVLSKGDPHIQAPLCTSVKLNRGWRFHFPSSWPQPLVFFSPGHRWDRPVLACSATQSRTRSLDCCGDVVAVGCCFEVEPSPERSPKTGQKGMPEPGEVLCSSQRLNGDESDGQEDGEFLWTLPAKRHRSSETNRLCVVLYVQLATFSTVVQFSSLGLWDTKFLWIAHVFL